MINANDKMVQIIQGFNVGSPLPIDGRILLSRAEMASINDDIMPDKYFCICEEDGLIYLYDKTAEVDPENGRFKKAAPEKTSDLVNDGNGEATSEGYDQFDTVSSVEGKLSDLESQIYNDLANDYVNNEELETALSPYSKTINTAYSIKLESDSSEYSYTLSLLKKDGSPIGDSVSFDLPVESLVVDVDYVEDSEGKAIIITLENGHQTRVPVDAIIAGLVDETTFNAHVNNVYDPESSAGNVGHLHIVEDQARAWDAKYDLPQTGVPKNQLSSGVQTSLDKADSALQDNDNISRLTNDAEYISVSTLKEGDNVEIEETSEGIVISAANTIYTAGPGITISDEQSATPNVISATATAPTWKDIADKDQSDVTVYPLENDQLRELLYNDDSPGFVVHKVGVLNDKQDKIDATHKLSASLVSGLASVAMTGSYTDLSDKPTIPDELADLQSDTSHRVVTDVQIGAWSNKQDALTSSNAGTGISIVNGQDGVVISNTNVSAVWGNIQGSISNQTDLVSYVATNGGKIDSISVNGVEQDIDSSKNVDIDVPTRTSDLINDGDGSSSEIDAFVKESDIADFVTESEMETAIATNTATFRGTYESVSDLPTPSAVPDLKNNDYAFIITSVSGNPEYRRYKYTSSGWVFEYTLNNSSFTSTQWSAINSGATATNIGQIATNTGSINTINGKIPSSATSSNKLVTESDVANNVKTSGTSGSILNTINGTNLYNSSSSADLSLSDVGLVSELNEAILAGNAGITKTYSSTNKTLTLAHTEGYGAGTYGYNGTQSPGFGSTISVPYIANDKYGHVDTTNSSTTTVTIPALSDNTTGLPSYLTSTSGINYDTTTNKLNIRSTTYTLPTTGWSTSSTSEGTTYYYEAIVNGVTADSIPVISLIIEPSAGPTSIKQMQESWSYVYTAITSANKVTFYSVKAPIISYTVAIKGY